MANSWYAVSAFSDSCLLIISSSVTLASRSYQSRILGLSYRPKLLTDCYFPFFLMTSLISQERTISNPIIRLYDLALPSKMVHALSWTNVGGYMLQHPLTRWKLMITMYGCATKCRGRIVCVCVLTVELPSVVIWCLVNHQSSFGQSSSHMIWSSCGQLRVFKPMQAGLIILVLDYFKWYFTIIILYNNYYVHNSLNCSGWTSYS